MCYISALGRSNPSDTLNTPKRPSKRLYNHPVTSTSIFFLNRDVICGPLLTLNQLFFILYWDFSTANFDQTGRSTPNTIISRLNRIKKIARHRNGTVTSEKYLKLQKFWCMPWPPENSGSREIFISSFRHFELKFGCYFTKVSGVFAMHFGSQP